MKAKIGKTGSGFAGILNYAFDIEKGTSGEKEARLIGGNMCGDDPKSLAKEFKSFRELRPDIKKPVWHCSLRPPEGEKITDEKWQDIGDDFMKRMGFTDKHPYVMTMHKDGGMHIVASRIALDGSLYIGKFDAKRAIRITQQLEKDYGLTRTKGLAEVERINKKGERYTTIEKPDKRRGGVKEQEMYQRMGEVSPRQRLQQIIDKASADRPNCETYEKRLVAAGIEVKANRGLMKGSKMNGYSYQLDGVAFKASELGKAYGWGQFQSRLDLERKIDRHQDETKVVSQTENEPVIVNVIERITVMVDELERQYKTLNEQERQLRTQLPDHNKYRDMAREHIGHEIEHRRERVRLMELRRDLQTERYHWQTQGERNRWTMNSKKPNFMKSEERLAWEAKGRDIEQRYNKTEAQIADRQQKEQQAGQYLNSPKGQREFEVVKKQLLDRDYPNREAAAQQIKIIEGKQDRISTEKYELEKVRDDLAKHSPTITLKMSRVEDIRDTIKRPELQREIERIEKVKEIEKTRNRGMER
jgi:hypothetical protein